MGRELSSGVLKEFDPDEIKIVTRAAADLKPISTPELEAIIEEFAQNFSTGPNIFGTVGELEKLLTGVLPPDQVSDIISDVLGNANKSVWERIASVSESLLANYLLKKHPQIGAILSRVKPACAAKIMSQIPRMCEQSHAAHAQPEAGRRGGDEQHREDHARRFHGKLRARMQALDTYPSIADIINKMERRPHGGVPSSPPNPGRNRPRS